MTGSGATAASIPPAPYHEPVTEEQCPSWESGRGTLGRGPRKGRQVKASVRYGALYEAVL